MASGAVGLFFWIVSILDGWAQPTVIPATSALGALEGMEMLKGIFVVIGSLLLSVSLILCGFLFVKLPKLTSAEVSETDSLEKKFNKLQMVVWKLLQKIKDKKS